MERPLVVTDPRESVTGVIREAGDLATAVDAPLIVLTVVTEAEYQNDAEVLERIEDVEGARYAPKADEYAEKVAQTAIDDLLSDLDLETEAIGMHVTDEEDRAGAILRVAEANDCDYIFCMGEKRSPAGKAIFGDTLQSVVLNFDRYVVTRSE